ncbi:MAG: hypothetical protein ACRENL_11980 [Candidatus Dormibacteria bacterium]
MKRSHPPTSRPIGVPRLPRRRFLAPTAVRVAQLCLLFRIAFVVVLVLAAPTLSIPTNLVIPGVGQLTLPGAATWSALAVWVVAAAIFEGALVLRLGRLRIGSRRVILLVESMMIAASGLYIAAGLRVALVALVSAITATVLLRLDHVRRCFERAQAERRVLQLTIPAVLFEGYAPGDPLAPKEIQRIGYRVGVDSERVAAAFSEMSRV